MRGIALGLVLLLAACGSSGPPPPPPTSAVQPEPIDYFVITKNKLYGSGCNFVADNGGMTALVLAQEKEAIFKLKGQIVRVAADKTSQILPESAHSRYSDDKYTVLLAPIPGTEPKENGVIQSLPTSLAIMDPKGRVQFAAKGTVQCKPM